MRDAEGVSDEKPTRRTFAEGAAAHHFPKGVSGNPAGRPRGIERQTRDQVESYTVEDPDLGVLTGWDAIRRRLYLRAIGAIVGRAQDEIAAAKLLFERGFGSPKSLMKIEADGLVRDAADGKKWDEVPIDRRRELLAAAKELGTLDDDIKPTEH